MGTDDFANNFKKYSYRNLLSSDEPSTIKTAEASQKSIFLTTNSYSFLTVNENPEIVNPSQNPLNEASDDISEAAKSSLSFAPRGT